ncbi:MAG TPA: N-acetylglucosamine-6-phosphate deacetylase [Clostridia bacterium]|nr:N-acetylglucosamine-6-phosphate deacetylase [Clostridia bacterium]
MGKSKIINGRLITPYRIIEGAELTFEDGIITGIGNRTDDTGYETVDAGGCYVTPGFIDIHSHGGGGMDFMDEDPSVFDRISRIHSRYGTTMIFPTLTSSRFDVLKSAITSFSEIPEEGTGGARMPGLHLEGPYFSMEQRGAQDPRYVRPPDRNEYMEILDMTDRIARWSLAPELPGANEFASELRKRGIVPAIGHSNATYEQVLEAFENGFELITHLYSGCSIMRRINAYRVAGVVESAFLIDGMNVEIIADGHHLPPSLLKLIYQNKSVSRIALVTDSIRAAGDSSIETIVGDKETGVKAIVEDGVAKLPDRSAFAGSVATADRLIRTMVNNAGVPIEKAVEMLTSSPARIMNVYDRAGSLSTGKYADFVFLDENHGIRATIIGGRKVFEV